MKRLRIWSESRELLRRIKIARGTTSLHQTILWIAQDARAAKRAGSELPDAVTLADPHDIHIWCNEPALDLLDELMRMHPRQPRSRQDIIHWLAVDAAASLDAHTAPALGQPPEDPASKRQEVAAGADR